MKIRDLYVNWQDGWGNSPDIHLLVDRLPDPSEYRYKQKGDLFFAELDGSVSFYHWKEERGNNRGYSGADFPVMMEDGSWKVLLGPWSSRPGIMNQAGFTPSVHVSLTDDERVWKVGYTFWAGDVTFSLLSEAISSLPDVALRRIEVYGGEFDYQAWHKNGCFTCGKPRCDHFNGKPINLVGEYGSRTDRKGLRRLKGYGQSEVYEVPAKGGATV